MIGPTRQTPDRKNLYTWIAYVTGLLAISAVSCQEEAVGLFHQLNRLTRGAIAPLV